MKWKKIVITCYITIDHRRRNGGGGGGGHRGHVPPQPDGSRGPAPLDSQACFCCTMVHHMKCHALLHLLFVS